MTINELREKRNNAWNAAKAFLDCPSRMVTRLRATASAIREN